MGQGAPGGPKAPQSDREARQLFEKLDLQPWDSRGLIRAVLLKQSELAKKSDLRKVPVKDGFNKILDKKRKDAARGKLAKEISKPVFVDLCVDLLKDHNIPGSVADQDVRGAGDFRRDVSAW
ncbi:unnamed protein product [Prorocentrum cordatum]|uniref:Uncharacterized protein n=1 Tax=Prorocentrum cordatum TaxID=2364126 RepID=A0ABN9XMJ0_9DINO|nr:unnamed protein product [Polarella glacialis]